MHRASFAALASLFACVSRSPVEAAAPEAPPPAQDAAAVPADAAPPRRPGPASVSVDRPGLPWIAARLEEIAQFTALRGAESLADAALPEGESKLRLYVRSAPRRAVLQVRRGPAGVRGEVWLWWWPAGARTSSCSRSSASG